MKHPDDFPTLPRSTLHAVTGGVAIASGGGSSDVNANLLTAIQGIKSSITDIAKAKQPDNSMTMLLPMMMMMKQRQG